MPDAFGFSVDPAWETPARGRGRRRAPMPSQPAVPRQQPMPAASAPAPTTSFPAAMSAPPIPTAPLTGYQAGGSVGDDDDTVYPTTAPKWDPYSAMGAMGAAGGYAPVGYARGGPVRPAHHAHVVQRAVLHPRLNMDQKASVLAGLRKRYDAHIGMAQGAMAHGDINSAMHLATAAHDHVPDGKNLTFQGTDDGNVGATLQSPDGSDKTTHKMTPDQFHRYVIGPATSFDHVIDNGAHKNLQIASGGAYARGGPVEPPDHPIHQVRQVLDHTRRMFGLHRIGQAVPRTGYQGGGPVDGDRPDQDYVAPQQLLDPTQYQDVAGQQPDVAQAQPDQPVTAESDLQSLLGAAARKFWGSRAGIKSSPSSVSLPGLAKQALADYVNGTNAAAPEELDAHVARTKDELAASQPPEAAEAVAPAAAATAPTVPADVPTTTGYAAAPAADYSPANIAQARQDVARAGLAPTAAAPAAAPAGATRDANAEYVARAQRTGGTIFSNPYGAMAPNTVSGYLNPTGAPDNLPPGVPGRASDYREGVTRAGVPSIIMPDEDRGWITVPTDIAPGTKTVTMYTASGAPVQKTIPSYWDPARIMYSGERGTGGVRLYQYPPGTQRDAQGNPIPGSAQGQEPSPDQRPQVMGGTEFGAPPPYTPPLNFPGVVGAPPPTSDQSPAAVAARTYPSTSSTIPSVKSTSGRGAAATYEPPARQAQEAALQKQAATLATKDTPADKMARAQLAEGGRTVRNMNTVDQRRYAIDTMNLMKDRQLSQRATEALEKDVSAAAAQEFLNYRAKLLTNPNYQATDDELGAMARAHQLLGTSSLGNPGGAAPTPAAPATSARPAAAPAATPAAPAAAARPPRPPNASPNAKLMVNRQTGQYQWVEP